MKLANFSIGGSERIGFVFKGEVIDLTAGAEWVASGLPGSIDEALGDWERASRNLEGAVSLVSEDREAAKKLRLKVERVKFLPPVRNPSKILCVFVNYRSHGQEVGSPPSEPVFFFKQANGIVGDGDDVLVPKFSTKPDHEVELGVIIGKKGKDIKPSEAYDHIAGYTVLNDVSFRDGMRRGVEGTVLGRNLFKGKVADTALPMGPCLVTKDEIGNPYPLRISLKVNGETRQDGTTEDMIFKIPELLASASEDNTLLPGDVIATGTCSGVGLYTGKYLKDGDFIEAEVERVGVLRNRVRTQTAG